MDSNKQLSILNEENEKKETKIKLSPGDQAMIDYMDKPIDWERANRIAKLMEAYLRDREEEKSKNSRRNYMKDLLLTIQEMNKEPLQQHAKKLLNLEILNCR